MVPAYYLPDALTACIADTQTSQPLTPTTTHYKHMHTSAYLDIVARRADGLHRPPVPHQERVRLHKEGSRVVLWFETKGVRESVCASSWHDQIFMFVCMHVHERESEILCAQAQHSCTQPRALSIQRPRELAAAWRLRASEGVMWGRAQAGTYFHHNKWKTE